MTRIGFFATVVAGLTLLQSVSAHYQLTYPESRGFSEDNEPSAPCGGFNTASSNRTQFPLKNGFVEINSGHTSYSYEIKLVTNSANPSASDFSSAPTVANGSRNYPGEGCLPIDLSSVSNASAGTNATIQVIYDGGDGSLYQCVDVTLAENPSNFDSSACVNADGSDPTGSSSVADGGNSGASGLTVASGVFAAAFAAAISIAA
ncbi:hypothetical protein BDC45DRAFT_515502 [Circinella umbellata]|nr:hypothetical protein BDC45DRAFT_515502 [Circinella umbellata]